ncbi:hypothetical protein KY284_007906 [Solanum tuberosum]|nr:hypothetical protein KY284_007906 [Solanum tuberosum]
MPLQYGRVHFIGYYFKVLVTNKGYPMDMIDKSWMNLPRSTNEYERGVNVFLDKAFERASQGNEIVCPCRKCFNRYWHYRSVVENHLIAFGFARGGYTN